MNCFIYNLSLQEAGTQRAPLPYTERSRLKSVRPNIVFYSYSDKFRAFHLLVFVIQKGLVRMHSTVVKRNHYISQLNLNLTMLFLAEFLHNLRAEYVFLGAN